MSDTAAPSSSLTACEKIVAFRNWATYLLELASVTNGPSRNALVRQSAEFERKAVEAEPEARATQAS